MTSFKITSVVSGIGTVFAAFTRLFAVRRDEGPIDTVDKLNHFVTTRAAFIAQKTLYGYLKTRMGTSYPKMFENDVFAQSINIAKMHVFTACLSDLTIFAVAHATRSAGLKDEAREQLALACFQHGLDENEAHAPRGDWRAQALTAFQARLTGTNWHAGALERDNFVQSPAALVKWAPIAPELKKYDTEIVENSIRFAWNDVRARFLERLDVESMALDRKQDDFSKR